MLPHFLNLNISKTSWHVTIKFYLKHQWSLENAAIGLGADKIRTLVSMLVFDPTLFSSPVQSTGRAIVVTLASALALALTLAFPSRHF